MIYVAGDHHAEPALVRIRKFLDDGNMSFVEFGYRSGKDPTASLQDFIPAVAEAVQNGVTGDSGVLVCGTGAGVEIGANRFRRVRASLCTTPQGAEWARVYDDANVLCIASWALAEIELEAILNRWYSSEYDGSTTRRQMFRAFDSWTK